MTYFFSLRFSHTSALGTVFGSTTLTVSAATLVSIGVTPTNPSIAKGTRQQFTATGIYTDNSIKDLTAAVTWSSSDTTVAAVSNAAGSQGLATAVGSGSTFISAALGNTTSVSVTLTVTAAEYAYAVNTVDDTVSQYTIAAGGALTPISPATAAAGASPASVAIAY
jgi:hypothetical protein